jgi:hypothetical protein
MKVRKSFIATDENGNEVFVAKSDVISEISDNGYRLGYPEEEPQSEVVFRVTPSHKLWSEIVTCDAVKLLKALE